MRVLKLVACLLVILPSSTPLAAQSDPTGAESDPVRDVRMSWQLCRSLNCITVIIDGNIAVMNKHNIAGEQELARADLDNEVEAELFIRAVKIEAYRILFPGDGVLVDLSPGDFGVPE